LVVSPSDFEVKGRDGIIGGGNVGVEVGLGDVFNEGLAPVFVLSVSIAIYAVGRELEYGFTVGRRNGC